MFSLHSNVDGGFATYLQWRMIFGTHFMFTMQIKPVYIILQFWPMRKWVGERLLLDCYFLAN